MAYECKVFDKDGKLKKILQGQETISKEAKTFLEQKSTKKAAAYIKKLRESPKEINHNTKFYNKVCIVCSREFHPRHPQTKYCSHECQKKLYLKKKKLIKLKNPKK